MANILTTAITSSIEDKDQLFLRPFFIDGELANEFTVHMDVKGSKKLGIINAVTGITKAYQQGTSFTPSTGLTITQKTLTVSDLKAEFQQNGKAFKDSIYGLLTKSGVDENNIEDTAFQAILFDRFLKGVKGDLMVSAWMNDTAAEVVSSGVKTGVAQTYLNTYTGMWTRLIADFKSGALPAAQRVTMSNGSVKQKDTITITGTSGTANVTVMGKTYLATFASDLDTTAANFVTAHAAALLARGVTVTSGTATIILESAIEGVSIGTTAISAAITGNLTGSRAATVANTAPSALATDEAMTALGLMVEAMPNQLGERKADTVIYATRSMVENYKKSLRALNGSESAYMTTVNGINTVTFDGIPVIEKASLDTTISTYYPNQYPHRAVMCIKENMIFGTDGADDSTKLEFFYDKISENNVLRAEYKGGTQYLEENYIVAAF